MSPDFTLISFLLAWHIFIPKMHIYFNHRKNFVFAT